MDLETLIEKGDFSPESVEEGLYEAKVPEVLIAALIGSWEAIDKYFEAAERPSVEEKEKTEQETIAALYATLPYKHGGVFEVNNAPWEFLGYSLISNEYRIRVKRIGNLAMTEIHEPEDFLYFNTLEDYHAYTQARDMGTQHIKRS